MQTPHILTHLTLQRAILVVALLLGGATSVAGMPSAAEPRAGNSVEPVAAHTVVRLRPADRTILLIESRDPENTGLRFVIAQDDGTETPPASLDAETPINLCLPCEALA